MHKSVKFEVSNKTISGVIDINVEKKFNKKTCVPNRKYSSCDFKFQRSIIVYRCMSVKFEAAYYIIQQVISIKVKKQIWLVHK